MLSFDEARVEGLAAPARPIGLRRASPGRQARAPLPDDAVPKTYNSETRTTIVE
jgi:hypothetical protein